MTESEMQTAMRRCYVGDWTGQHIQGVQRSENQGRIDYLIQTSDGGQPGGYWKFSLEGAVSKILSCKDDSVFLRADHVESKSKLRESADFVAGTALEIHCPDAQIANAMQTALISLAGAKKAEGGVDRFLDAALCKGR